MKKPKAPEPSSPFWFWSNRQGAGTRAENFRTVSDLLDPPPYEILDRMNYGHGPLDPADVPLFEGNLAYKNRVEDCPWAMPTMFVVSDRLRGILEVAAPDNCQFFPMKLWHNGRPCPLVYWAMYVDSVDCADQEKSGRSGSLIVDPVIIEDQVPTSTHVFRVKIGIDSKGADFSSSGILVRDALRRTLKKEKVTGCGFYQPPKPSEPWDVSETLTSDPGAPLSEDQVVAAERELGCTLPDDYRDFIKRYNGRRLRPHLLMATDNDGTDFRFVKNISLLPLVTSAGGGSTGVLSSRAEWKPLLPQGCIAIGVSKEGTGVVLYVEGPRRGEVWLKESKAGPADPESGMFPCSRSFMRMMRSLDLD